jgi:hypothetical protein
MMTNVRVRSFGIKRASYPVYRPRSQPIFSSNVKFLI